MVLGLCVLTYRTQRQKLVLGPSFDKVQYVQCDVEPKTCAAAGVRGVPQWRVGDTTLYGYQPLQSLVNAVAKSTR